MTLDDGLALADEVLRLRREIAGLARSIDVASATFTAEWTAALSELQTRLARIAAIETCLGPVLVPAGIEEFRAWLVRMRPLEALPAWLESPPTALQPSSTVH